MHPAQGGKINQNIPSISILDPLVTSFQEQNGISIFSGINIIHPSPKPNYPLRTLDLDGVYLLSPSFVLEPYATYDGVTQTLLLTD